MSTADRSPVKTPCSIEQEPPSVRVLPSKTRVWGCAWAYTEATSRIPSVWFHQTDSRVTGMYLLRSEVVPDERAKSVTRPGAVTSASPALIRAKNGLNDS